MRKPSGIAMTGGLPGAAGVRTSPGTALRFALTRPASTNIAAPKLAPKRCLNSKLPRLNRGTAGRQVFGGTTLRELRAHRLVGVAANRTAAAGIEALIGRQTGFAGPLRKRRQCTGGEPP